jgi:hypothetical protein
MKEISREEAEFLLRKMKVDFVYYLYPGLAVPALLDEPTLERMARGEQPCRFYVPESTAAE